jgi:diketogulonate reductase-like aldo/keto reductase
MDDKQVRDAVPAALGSGYRLVDTASRYYNEKEVGGALADAGVPRNELFITTKLWFKNHADLLRARSRNQFPKGLPATVPWSKRIG